MQSFSRRCGGGRCLFIVLIVVGSVLTVVLHVNWISPDASLTPVTPTVNKPQIGKFRFRSRQELKQTGENQVREKFIDEFKRVIAEHQLRNVDSTNDILSYRTTLPLAANTRKTSGENLKQVIQELTQRGRPLTGSRHSRHQQSSDAPTNDGEPSEIRHDLALDLGDDSDSETGRVLDSDQSQNISSLVGGPGKCKVYNVKRKLFDVPGADFPASECVSLDAALAKLPTVKSVIVCPYPDDADVHLSKPLRLYKIWEPHIVTVFMAAVSWMMTTSGRTSKSTPASSSVGIYDIGANVGQYSLLAAGAFGCRVVAVEPYIPSIYRLHKAVEINRILDKVIIVENAVSDVRDTFELSVADGNPSGAVLMSQDADRYCNEPGCPVHATTIFMDDLLEVTNFDVAVMKIDIEGFEHRAFVHSSKLFNDVKVAYIFMEWTRIRTYYGAQVDSNEDKSLAEGLVHKLSAILGYTAYSLSDMQRLEPRYWYGWPNDIVWVHKRSPQPRDLLSRNNTPVDET